MSGHKEHKLLGEKVVSFLQLKPVAGAKTEKALYNTSWGSKTVVGLGACIERLYSELGSYQPFKYCSHTETLRTVPENYCVATFQKDEGRWLLDFDSAVPTEKLTCVISALKVSFYQKGDILAELCNQFWNEK